MNTQNTIQKTFNYEGNAITFQSGNGVMVNATEMAKPFGKSARGWLRNQQSEEFINELAALRNCNATDLVVVKNGGNNFGTWMHEDVALEFARWLSPKFAIWCNDRIKELLTNGVAYNIPQTYADALALAAEQAKAIEMQAAQLNEAKQHIAIAEEVIEQNERQLAEQAPKVLFADSVSASKDAVLIAELAKILTQKGMKIGQNRLFRLMRENGFLCSHGSYYNQPTQRATEMGLFQLQKGSVSDPYGTTHSFTTPKVTGKGLQYFVNFFLAKTQPA